jgi:hypothetical protein
MAGGHSRREFDKMRERHRIEIERERIRRENERRAMNERLARAGAEGLEEARQKLERIQRSVEAARAEFERLGNRPKRRRPPRRGLEGGEPVPVTPRPKPTPLVGGAEAPID